MPTNFYMIFVAALIPMVVGAIYYSPKVAGTVWMNVNGFTEESLKGANMAVILSVSYVLSIFLAFAMITLTIHQQGVFAIFVPEIMDSGSAAQQQYNDLMAEYGTRYRSFKHGVLHGGIAATIIALPLIGINALFERRGWKYIGIHFVYWFITFILMGGLLCSTLHYAPAS